VNRLVREGEIGYQPSKTKKNDEHQNEGEEENERENNNDFDYSNLLNTSTDDRPITGKTDRYEWSQSKEEIEVYIPLSKYGEKISSNELDVVLQPNKFIVILRREVIFNEEFSYAIKVDDSCWMIDNNTVGNPHIWMNLTKATPTVRNQHWKSLFKGGPEVDVGRLGPPVHAIDPSDPSAKDSFKSALKSVKLIDFFSHFIPLLNFILPFLSSVETR
jgi:hypothetical protein